LILFALATGPARADARADEAAYRQALAQAEGGNYLLAVDQLQNFLRTQPDHAGAWLDLALFACQAGQQEARAAALAWLDAHGPLPPIIDEILTLQRHQTCPPENARRGRGEVGVALGLTHNLNLAAQQSTIQLPNAVTLQLDRSLRPRNAPFGAVSGLWQQPLPLAGQQLALAGYVQNYQSDSQYNTALIQARWESMGQYKDIYGAQRLSLTNYWLGGQDYLRAWSGQSAWQWNSPASSLHPSVQLTATGLDYRTLRNYNALVIEPALGLAWRAGANLQLRGLWGRQIDKADGARPGGDRQGPFWQLEGRYALGQSGLLELTLRHDRLVESLPYAPFLFGPVVRRTNLTQLAVSWKIRLDPSSQIEIESRLQRQRDPLPLFDYRSDMTSIGWRQFF